MNWQTQLKGSIRDNPVATAPTAHPMVAQLRLAAGFFATRTKQDDFTSRSQIACLDLANKLEKFGSFASPAQEGYAAKLILWSKPRPVTASATPAAPGMTVPKLFTVMQKHSKFFAGALKITRRNQDSLCWLIWNTLCVGKIDGGVVSIYDRRIGADKDALVAMLVEFEANPLAAAVRYGKLSGTCCSCGRDLTNDGSIEAGIGPICAGRFS
jgi:hypothetical protein